VIVLFSDSGVRCVYVCQQSSYYGYTLVGVAETEHQCL